MYSTLLFVGLSLAAGGCAASACTGPQYNDVPGFGLSSGCYPLNYYQTSDLGQTSPDDARTRCQQQCVNMGSQCGSVVAQVNKAADSNLYPSGTCFFYAPGNTPASPRQCASPAYLLQAYVTDNTNNCFSSAGVDATSYCSSYLGIPVSTISSTVTSTPPVKTVTVTATTRPTTSLTRTVTTTPTVTASTSVTVVSTVTTSTTTLTVSVSSTTTTTTITTSTVTSTATTSVSGVTRRAVANVPPPACVTSGAPSTRISAACSCLSIKTSTTITKLTSTLRQITTTTTSTTTVPVSSTTTVTITAAPTTVTVTGTVTSSVTATSTITATNIIPVTVTVTQTSLTTTVVAPTCTSQKFVQAASKCYYNQYCQQYFTGVAFKTPITTSDSAACFTACDAYNKPGAVNCYGYTYHKSTQVCEFFAYETGYYQGGADVDSYYFSYCPYTD